SNARAAQMIHDLVSSDGTFAAAIASKRAAELFDLNILAENIEDDAKNTTRFLVLGTHEVAASGADKTSIVMTSKNIPGAMVQLLEPLSRHGVSMTKFESRPSKQGLWDYVFFVDIEGHQTDAKVQAALAECQRRASFLKVLGSYPVAVI
ncbi:MAG: prephenate dehydratase domain-containing protein, partial [Methylotenera sp.]